MLATPRATPRESRRLDQVVGWLMSEFGDRVDDDTIYLAALDEITHLRGARVQEFVATISWRSARARLEDLLVEERIESR